jgi:hypothetical protein
MISAQGLSRLSRAAELCLDRERIALSRIDHALMALCEEAELLQRDTAGSEDLLALRGEAASSQRLWEAWRERRLRELGLQVAELAADREEGRLKVARAYGRVIAVRKLIPGR